MSWLVRLFVRPSTTRTTQAPSSFAPELPPGFVRRSDPNFFYLARKF